MFRLLQQAGFEPGPRVQEAGQRLASIVGPIGRLSQTLVRQRICGAAVHTHLVMQVRTGCRAGGTYEADGIACGDALPPRQPVRHLTEMGVAGQGVRAMRDLDDPAIAAAPAHIGDAPGGRGIHGRPRAAAKSTPVCIRTLP